MKLACLCAAALVVWLPLYAQPISPTVPEGAVVSAADNSSAELGIAPGSLFTVYGSGFAAASQQAQGGELPTSLGGATVTVHTPSMQLAAPILFVGPSQINAMLPMGVPLGPAEISVQTSQGQSERRPILVVASRFSAFTQAGRPFGPALVQQYRSGRIDLNRMLSPASAGDALVIWGTGLGASGEQDGVAVWVGMTKLTPFYAGPAPGFPGVDQINVYLPTGAYSSCFVPFLVQTSIPSEVYTLATGEPDRPCPMSFALGREGLQRLDAGGIVRITAMTLRSDAAEAWVGEYDAANLSQLATHDIDPVAAPFTCARHTFRTERNQPPPRFSQMYGRMPASDLLLPAVAGPGGCPWQFVRAADGIYRAQAPTNCPAQTYSIRTPAVVSASLGNISFPPISPPTVSFDGGTGAVAWSGNYGGRLTLTLSSSFQYSGGILNGLTNTHELTCRLAGLSGTAQISAADRAFANRLPTTAAPRVEYSTGSSTGGSWAGPTEALHIRMLQIHTQ